jgi:hypothetical protein
MPFPGSLRKKNDWSGVHVELLAIHVAQAPLSQISSGPERVTVKTLPRPGSLSTLAAPR